MTIERIRAGWRPSVLDKARSCETKEELDGFAAQLKNSPEHVSKEDWAEIARLKIALSR